MKPGSRDIKYQVKIEGLELAGLKKCIWAMSESFGLDTRIDNYEGKRPIGLYRWDIECLVMAIEAGIEKLKKSKHKDPKELEALNNLYQKMQKLEEKAFTDY